MCVRLVREKHKDKAKERSCGVLEKEPLMKNRALAHCEGESAMEKQNRVL